MVVKRISFVLFVCSVLVLSESAFVDNLGKCSISDAACQKNLLQSVIRDAGKSGIPDYGIPPFDPFVLKNVTVNILNSVEIIITDGVAKGVKDCVVNKLETVIEENRASMELTCDLVIKGKYKVHGTSLQMSSVLGANTIHGNGNTKIKLDKMNIKFNYDIKVKRKNGEIFIVNQVKGMKYTYTLGNINMAADSFYIGDTESSAFAVNAFNQNWKVFLQSFGKPFLDKAVSITYEQARKFFDVVPAKYYISDDLTPYVQED